MPVLLMTQTRVVLASVLLLPAASAYEPGAITARAISPSRLFRNSERSGRFPSGGGSEGMGVLLGREPQAAPPSPHRRRKRARSPSLRDRLIPQAGEAAASVVRVARATSQGAVYYPQAGPLGLPFAASFRAT